MSTAQVYFERMEISLGARWQLSERLVVYFKQLIDAEI